MSARHKDGSPFPLWQILEEEEAVILAARGGAPAAVSGVAANENSAARRESGEAESSADARDRARTEDFYRRTHGLEEGRSAFCISGGGIRSATFNLGVLQVLARRGLLQQVDYLSTVSGGGYIGSWLSAWAHHAAGGLAEVADALNPVSRDATHPEPPQVRHLREYSNYFSPRLGLFSADTWTLAAIYLRNLLLNWLVLLPLIAAALMVPRLGVWVLWWIARSNHHHLLIVFSWLLLAGAFILCVVALAYLDLYRPSFQKYREDLHPHDKPTRKDGHRPFNAQNHFLFRFLLPLYAATLLASTAWAGLYRSMAVGFKEGFTAAQFLPLFLSGGTLLHVVSWAVHFKRLRPEKTVASLLGNAAGGCAAGAMIWVVTLYIFPHPNHLVLRYVCFAAPLLLLAFNVAGALLSGLLSRENDDADREFYARVGAWVLIAGAVWAGVSAVVLLAPTGLLMLGGWAMSMTAVAGGSSAVFTAFLGRSAKTPGGSREAPKTKTLGAYLRQSALALAAPLFVVLVGVFLSLGTDWLIDLSYKIPHTGPDWHVAIVRHAPPLAVVMWFAIFLVVGGVMSGFVNINKFSLQSTYRDRLVRAYLGAARPNRTRSRTFNRFTGFDPEDNPRMRDLALPGPAALARRLKDSPADPVSAYLLEQLPGIKAEVDQWNGRSEPAEEMSKRIREKLDDLLDAKRLDGVPCFQALMLPHERVAPGPDVDPDKHRQRLNRLLLGRAFPRRPFHILNIALNLVAGTNLAWQQRKAESFTASPLHCGTAFLNYRDSALFGGELDPRKPKAPHNSVSLGSALGISGAAASPNWGYHSSPPIAFLLATLNVRLGAWAGNPGKAGDLTFGRSSPEQAAVPLFAEAFALTNSESPYVYLSDGGHFDNLGLYEMVRRRCRHIVVSDAGQDESCSFEDLGNALRKIYIDMGVRMTLESGPMAIYPRDPEPPEGKGRYCATFTIHYKEVDGKQARNGRLLYLKPAYYGSEPPDVCNYAKQYKDFPHESTLDQFFSESQFESYRALGVHMTEIILGGPNAPGPKTVDGMIEAASKYLGGGAAAAELHAMPADGRFGKPREPAAQAPSPVRSPGGEAQ